MIAAEKKSALRYTSHAVVAIPVVSFCRTRARAHEPAFSNTQTKFFHDRFFFVSYRVVGSGCAGSSQRLWSRTGYAARA